MDLAKSLFESRNHEGYVGKDAHTKRELELAIEPDDAEDTFIGEFSQGLTLANSLTPTPGSPFSALTPSMWPQDIIAKQLVPDDPNSQPEYRFDEFGFRVDEEDGPEQNSNKLLGIPFVEDPQHRLQWVAHLEFSHNTEVSDLTWDKVEVRLLRTDKLLTMVQSGIPHSLRPQMWMRMSGALEKKQKSELCYKDIVKMSSNDSLMSSKQIEKDLLHTMPTNACYSHTNSTGIPRLRRILRGIAWLYPEIGYCQGMGMIVASLLLFMEEENAFWIMVTIVEDLLPASYYSSTLLGIQADQRVLRTFITNYLPDTDEMLKNHDIELSLITLHWFLTLFASVVHMKILLRIWDLFFFEGSIVLFQITLSMLKMKEPHLKDLENSAQIFNALSDIPGDIDDVDTLFEVSKQLTNSMNDVMLETYRRRHLAYLMADQGALVGNPEAASNLPKQHLARRQNNSIKSRSVWFEKCYVVCFSLNFIMDDGKRENNKLKRSKTELKNVSIYLQKRNYCPLQIFESTRKQQMTNSTVGLYACPKSSIVPSTIARDVGRSNSVLYSCYNIDPMVIDHNFTKFLIWLREQTKHRSCCLDIEQLTGSLFCHLYLDMIRGGHADRASAFYKCHFSSVENKCNSPLKELINLIGNDNDLNKYKECSKLKDNFRSKKIVVPLSAESLSSLKKFVLENCHVVFLQVLQTWFDFHIITERICKDEEMMTVSSVEYPKDSKFQKLINAIRELEKEPTPIFNVHINFSKRDVSCGLLRRQCGLVAFADENVLRLMPVHALEFLFNQQDNHDQIVLTNHSGQIYCIDISPLNDLLVTGSADCTICLYNLASMTLIRKCTGHLGPVYCIKISGNAEFIVTGSMDGTARLWQPSNGNILRILTGHTQPVTCVEFHPNCLYVATGSADKNIRLWCVNKATTMRLFHASKGTIYALAFSPCGKLLASACEDKKIRVWDLLTAKVTVELRCKDSVILRLLWSTDGSEICAGTVNGVIRIWNFAKTLENCENNKQLEPIFMQALNTPQLLCIEYMFGTYGTLTAD
ncbi:hypothetical protein JTB14_007571 [Gonioctena quinquepunctata]|nr:hypothetical protein JTB14_007571 [Gonioctena quinquepunctata]